MGKDGNKKESKPLVNSDDFKKFFKFGVIDNGLLIATTISGFHLDAKIAARTGVRGYGPLLGASVGNALSDFIAGLPEGPGASLGVTSGAMLPVLPVFLAMKLGRDLKGPTAAGINAIALGATALCFMPMFTRKDDD